MRVLLVKPNNLSDHIQPSLGLGYMASQLRSDHDVDIYDSIKEAASPEQVAKVVEATRTDVVGIQCYTFDIPKVKETLEAIKQRCPQTLTVVGGAHVTAEPVMSMRDFGSGIADFGVSGEGEFAMRDMLREIESGRNQFEPIQGAIWRHDGKVHHNGPAIIHDLDSLKMPAYDIIRPDTYPESQQGAFFENFPIAPIVTTRGCPYRCGFCAAPNISGRKLRHHSVEYVREMILTLYYRYGIREIHIVDDNFTFNINYAKSILQMIMDEELDLTLALPNGIRMDRVDDELLEMLKSAGVYIVSVAIESGNDRILKEMHKGTTTAKIRENVSRIRKHKMDVAAFFIVGYPGETEETIRDTAKFARDLDIQRAQFMTFAPLPGSSAYQELVESGEIGKVAWEDSNFAFASYAPKGMTRDQVLKLKRSAFFGFYLRPRVFISHIFAIRSFRHFQFLCGRFYRWIVMKPPTSDGKRRPSRVRQLGNRVVGIVRAMLGRPAGTTARS